MDEKLLTNPSSKSQPNLFYGSLMDVLDSSDPLIALANTIPWKRFETSFSSYYSEEGRPAKPIRLMVGLLLLKQLENLSDESVVLQFKRNPYYQYFCGYTDYSAGLPCDASDLVYFRKRIGVKGVEQIFAMSVGLHGKKAQEKQVLIDTTVQENNITYPTDGKLAIKIINHLHKIAKHERIQLRRTFMKEIKQHRIALRFFRHPKKIKKAKGAMKRLRTIAKTILRDIDRKFGDDMGLHATYANDFYLYMRILLQTKESKHKVYSLHETHIHAIAKGKDHKKYEYGTKASIVTTKNSGVIVGVVAHEKNEHDSKTLTQALTAATANRTKPITEAICDRGYRGVKEVLGTTICIPSTPKKRDTNYAKEQKRKQFRRRAAIEPVIGHLKSDYRLSRNYLKGFIGDQINLLLAATAWNLKKWMNNFVHALFYLKDPWKAEYISILWYIQWLHFHIIKIVHQNLITNSSSH
jgi:IS5 family transposase